MQIVEAEPQLWYFAEEGIKFVFHAKCQYRFVDYSLTIELTPKEVSEYRRRGRSYLDFLARDIQECAPVLRTSSDKYRERDVSSVYSKPLTKAISEWQKNLTVEDFAHRRANYIEEFFGTTFGICIIGVVIAIIGKSIDLVLIEVIGACLAFGGIIYGVKMQKKWMRCPVCNAELDGEELNPERCYKCNARLSK